MIPGIKATIEEYPFIVHLTIEVDKVELKDLVKFFYCVGSLVDPMWVLTAAGCLNTNFLFPELKPAVVSKNLVELRVKLRKATPLEIAAEAAQKAVDVLIHPDYTIDKKKEKHNFGLVKLLNPFDLLSKSGVADIPDNNVNFEQNVTIVGYNQFMRNVAVTQNATDHVEKLDMSLQKLSSGVWAHDKCMAKADNNPAAICIGEPGRVPWIFDHGGPLLYEKKIVGIALGSDSPTEYGVYEDVYAHRAWLDSHIKANTTQEGGSAVQNPIIGIIYLNIAVVNLIKLI